MTTTNATTRPAQETAPIMYTGISRYTVLRTSQLAGRENDKAVAKALTKQERTMSDDGTMTIYLTNAIAAEILYLQALSAGMSAGRTQGKKCGSGLHRVVIKAAK